LTLSFKYSFRMVQSSANATICTISSSSPYFYLINAGSTFKIKSVLKAQTLEHIMVLKGVITR